MLSAHDLILTNTDYYERKFTQMDEKRTVISWNWAAFFFSHLWFIYRKMYLIGIALPVLLELLARFLPGFGLVTWLLPGLFANYLYRMHLRRIAMRLNDAGKRDQAALKKYGGTSLTAVFLYFAAIIGIFLVIYIVVSLMGLTQ